jgi:hypothetical protein
MQKAFPWLLGFMISQLALITIASLPLENWRSFSTPESAPPDEELPAPTAA